LRAQLSAVCRHRDKALNWKDPEGVHDMRVLSRRLRSAINDFSPYFRKGTLPRPKLRAIANKLGDVRDEDVALMALAELKSKAKGTAAEGIKLVADERRQQRKKARSALKSILQKPTIDDFRKDFLAKLRTITIAAGARRPGTQATQPALSFRSLGIGVIKARLKDFTAASPCLHLPYEIKRLHELRILAKRLRYSIELFSDCWGEEFAAMAKEVAHMQTSLGELHDCDVWIKDLGARLKRTARKATVDPSELKLRAAGAWLLKHFVAKRAEHYAAALERWEQWQADGFLEKLGLILNSGLPPTKSDQAT
ncbi:MAG TPA: CHAD domain-containing protein, partial [Pyrinomonadaceae bacterium]|nr:CHAD domain-containing protein [Pyrinomonadaceae bacterium]